MNVQRGCIHQLLCVSFFSPFSLGPETQLANLNKRLIFIVVFVIRCYVKGWIASVLYK